MTKNATRAKFERLNGTLKEKKDSTCICAYKPVCLPMMTDEQIENKVERIHIRLTTKEKKQFDKISKQTGLSYSEMLRKSAEIISAAVNKKPLNISDLFDSSKEAAELINKTIKKTIK